jgi:RimJ/RimL family protein N-acetyltransferase
MEGKLVRLRGYEKSDLEEVLKWWHDEEVTQFIGGAVFPASTLEEGRFIENVAAGTDPANKVFAIETVTDRKYIGTIGLHNINWLCGHAELGMVIGDKEYWGRGYGTDAVRALLRLAFDKAGLHRVHLHVFDFNHRAISCYEKCGFRHEGVLRDYWFKNGKFRDTLVMAILKGEYADTGQGLTTQRQLTSEGEIDG